LTFQRKKANFLKSEGLFKGSALVALW
jgi:hypothetical protein